MRTCLLLALALNLSFDDAKKGDAKAIDGTWNLVAMTFDGSETAAEKLKGRKVVIADGKMTAFSGGKKGFVNRLALDASKSPARIDLRRDGLDEPALGIYQRKGDRLTLCYGEPGKDRPSAFESKAGRRVFLLVLERAKE